MIYYENMMNRFYISHRNAVTFFRGDGEIHKHVKFLQDSVYQK